MASSSRGRDRRGDYRPSNRRSRSPIPPKHRSYSPPLKRKASPIPERELLRRQKISKSPVGPRSGSEHRYNAPEPNPRSVRNVSSSERFRDREYEEDGEGGGPNFRGPEGSIDYDINELKKFTIEIMRNPSSVHGATTINRSITNPEDIAPVRRLDTYERDYHYFDKGRVKDEGARPLFLRTEASTSKDRTRSDDYQRIVAIDNSRSSGGRDRAHSRERSPARYSPVPGPSHYDDHRRTYYPERERGHSPYEARHRSPRRGEYVEPRDKHRERRGESRDDLRRDLVVRKREERRYSPERRLSYDREHRERDRESDLRSRINEKRSDPHPSRIEERERERRYEGDRERGERHGRTHHSSPPRDRERRRPGSLERTEGSRDRREAWERDRDREGREREGRERESRRRGHSRDREREHSDHYESRHPSSSHKSDYEPKKFYKSYEPKEFVPPPLRGRGMPIRRGIPPILRGRGLVRGLNRGFRGGMMVPRGIPRGVPFIPRGFPPRFFPPY